MKLTTMHQLLIGGAIALGAIYALRSAWLFTRGGQLIEIGMGLGGAALAVGLTLYLRRFRQKLRSDQAPSPAEEAL